MVSHSGLYLKNKRKETEITVIKIASIKKITITKRTIKEEDFRISFP